MKRTKELRKRTGKECKKTDCISFEAGNIFGCDITFCKECKWAFNSQYERKRWGK